MKRKPIIGLTLDHNEGGEGKYSRFPWYAIRENYCTAVAEAGGMPIPLPYHPEMVEEYFAMIDGLIVTGGNFDVDPSYYGAGSKHQTVVTKDKRTQFEFTITKMAVERGKPVLGICGGEQLLNVVLGGSLIQHIPDSIEKALEHEQKNPRNEPGHRIRLNKGTRLFEIVGETEIDVNTAHHQAVDKPGKDVIVSATAEDGVIEGIEYPGHPFCIGVQWHPEYHVCEGDRRIFDAFLKAAA